METKLFEIRDKGTFIPALAIKLSAAFEASEEESYLLSRAGFFNDERPYVLLHHLNLEKCTYDSHNWGSRTMVTAHNHIIENWDSLKSGDVIDVEFILGESKASKTSERLETFTL